MASIFWALHWKTQVGILFSAPFLFLVLVGVVGAILDMTLNRNA